MPERTALASNLRPNQPKAVSTRYFYRDSARAVLGPGGHALTLEEARAAELLCMEGGPLTKAPRPSAPPRLLGVGGGCASPFSPFDDFIRYFHQLDRDHTEFVRDRIEGLPSHPPDTLGLYVESCVPAGRLLRGRIKDPSRMSELTSLPHVPDSIGNQVIKSVDEVLIFRKICRSSFPQPFGHWLKVSLQSLLELGIQKHRPLQQEPVAEAGTPRERL